VGVAAFAAEVERHSPRTGAPSLGPVGAGATLVFFTDYQCPVCPRAARELDQLVADFGGRVRVELKHHPLAMHSGAFDAAAAAKAAQRQGKFWDYHRLLIESRAFDPATLRRLAGEAGLDMTAFDKDFKDAALRQEVAAEAKQAESVGAGGTPGFLINGHVEVGWASYAWLRQVVERHMTPPAGKPSET